MNKIESLKMKFLRFNSIKSGIHENEEKKEMTAAQSRKMKKRLDNISFRISGIVAPGATLRIRYNEWETVYTEDRKNQLKLNISGRLDQNGKIRMEELICIPDKNPLRY